LTVFRTKSSVPAALFAAVLEALGFKVARHAARVVLFGLDRSEADPRVHDRGGRGRDLCCRSRLWSVRTPLSGAACGFVSGPDNYWMQRDGNFWVLHVTRGNGEPVAGWASTLEVENPLDFEVFNHYIATHPKSPFVNWIFLSAVTPEGRVKWT
jgi:N-hydroxyarylamine O-acetyltransferase